MAASASAIRERMIAYEQATNDQMAQRVEATIGRDHEAASRRSAWLRTACEYELRARLASLRQDGEKLGYCGTDERKQFVFEITREMAARGMRG